jgi:hypothetical protein
MAKMALGSPRKERHKHGHNHDPEGKRKHYMESFEDNADDQIAPDLRSVERTKRKKKRKRRSSGTLENSVFDGVTAMIDAKKLDLSLAKRIVEERNPHSLEKTAVRKSWEVVDARENEQVGVRAKGGHSEEEADVKAATKKRKRSSKDLTSSKLLDTQVVQSEQSTIVHMKGADEERARKREKKRRRREDKRAAKKSLEVTKNNGTDSAVANEQEAVVEKSKKRKSTREKRASHEDLQLLDHALDLSVRHTLTKDTSNSTQNKNKRKLDQSSQTSPPQPNSVPVYDAKSYLPSTIRASPPGKVKALEENNAKEPKKNQEKHRPDQSFQHYPLRLHAVPTHKPPTSSKHIIFDDDDNRPRDIPQQKKEKQEKNFEKCFLVPSSLLTPTAKANGALLQTVIKGCRSHVSSRNLLSEEVSISSTRSNNSTSADSSSEDGNEELPHTESFIRPLRPAVSISSSPSSNRPRKVVASEVKKETVILPPRRLIQTATRTPIVVTKLVRPKKAKAKSTADSDDDYEISAAQTRKASVFKASETVKVFEEAESLSQKAASINKATSTNMGELFPGTGGGEGEEESFSQVIDSMKKSSSKLRSLFSPEANTPSASAENKKGDMHAAPISMSIIPSRARSISNSLGRPLMSDEDGVNNVSDEWEGTVGKVRGSAQGEDMEAQESMLFPYPLYFSPVTNDRDLDIAFSSTYIASRSAGIKISNTTFQIHNLRHAEGWVIPGSQNPTERKTRNSGSAFQLKICTVISGRVQIRLGKDVFGIGKGGVFRVRVGEECVVRNGEKKVAVLWVVGVE